MTESNKKTAICETHGEYETETLTLGDLSITKPCQACVQDRFKKDEQLANRKAQQDKIARITAMLGHAGIPPRFRDRTFENYIPETPEAIKAKKICHAYAERFHERLQVGGCLVLCGLPGTGKSHLACAIANFVLLAHEKSTVFISTIDAICTIRETYHKDSQISEREAIARLVEPELLILDEVGVQSGSDHEKQTLFNIINKRYENSKPTILISNLEVEELSKYVGERVMSRMNQNGGTVISFTWSDYRVGRKA